MFALVSGNPQLMAKRQCKYMNVPCDKLEQNVNTYLSTLVAHSRLHVVHL